LTTQAYLTNRRKQVTTAEAQTTIPTGVWKSDHVHSHAGFAVTHTNATFRGDFEDFDASLDASGEQPRLSGAVRAASLEVRDEQLQGHLASPEFFDVARYPEIRFESSSVRLEDGKVVVEGELGIKDHKQAVRAEGRSTPVSASRPRSTAPTTGSTGTPTCRVAARSSVTRSRSSSTSSSSRRADR
jgi:polyisoprenoid-binding protein YceI